jgi:hypothetical protein
MKRKKWITKQKKKKWGQKKEEIDDNFFCTFWLEYSMIAIKMIKKNEICFLQSFLFI